MNDSSIAVRYAKALFELANEKKLADQVLQDLNSLEVLVRDVTEFRELIDSPLIQISDKIRIFKEVVEGNCTDLTFRFLELITRNKRESYLSAMIRKYQLLYRKDRGIISATLSTVTNTNETLTKRIELLLGDKYKANVELNQQQNPEIIGGFVLRVEDEMLDTSVAGQLNKIRREFDQSVMR
ncbi:MAG: ATP synthase F1 subunit delta [Bacteroidetes bacterium]|jgi:F-type H+-transporting ATPase subunit delta|nr:ATP synthase F1 subunit delta [Bacteroidota bacterium]MBT3748995.1 ATP synthase F1 subunit delta [Bacteroidota bacterium]MBT4398185.1 ATP synthase F1 subunit delta [Bacteroidota bacterium]MBT4409456.1 ATP synthase F1 subunit delta [Bacteroidota bacterium]MBT5428170.1 ATP synthase F1 subunit delta [Bacteroidota bacterium]